MVIVVIDKTPKQLIYSSEPLLSVVEFNKTVTF